MRRVLAVLALAGVVALMGAPLVSAAEVQVTFTQGTVFRGATRQGPWEPVQRGEGVSPASFLRTAEDGILELGLGDGSVVRLAPDSIYQVDEAWFETGKPRRFSAQLFVGKLWARVRQPGRGGLGRFENRIPTAVIGVRGTVYDLRAAMDGSAEVRVYAGMVAVGPPMLIQGGAREEMAWPGQVSEAQWEEIILGKLQRLRIGSDGRPGRPEAFDPRSVTDDWVKFNQRRDTGQP